MYFMKVKDDQTTYLTSNLNLITSSFVSSNDSQLEDEDEEKVQ